MGRSTKTEAGHNKTKKTARKEIKVKGKKEPCCDMIINSNKSQGEKRKNESDESSVFEEHAEVVKKSKDERKDQKKELDPDLWRDFEVFSPRKMSWILQDVSNRMKEMEKNIGKLVEEVNTINNVLTVSLPATHATNRSSLSSTETIEKMKIYYKNEMDETAQSMIWGFEDDEEHNSPKIMEPTFPLETMESLNQVEDKLRSKGNYASHLMNYHLLLLFATNDNPKVFLNKILNFLLTKKLGLEFTYSGTSRGSFKLLLLSDVIKRTVKKRFSDVDEKFFTERIGAWLSSCIRKYKREQKQK